MKDKELKREVVEQFKELGFKNVRWDFDYVLYEKSIDGGEDKKVVSFCNQNRSVKVFYEVSRDTPSIDMKLLKAINVQLLLLGWTE